MSSISSRSCSLTSARLGLAALATLALAGCSTSKLLDQQRHAVELDGVPFFAQERYQCGPAALATVLTYSGVATSPEQLVPLVYVPGRKGSFQAELKTATRSAGRLPYELDGSLAALLDEVAAGRPVLVLQNLGLSWLPKWHYAVVIGYDPTHDQILLRSGTEERRAESTRRFLYSWSLAGNWAFVVLRPGELPATAAADAYVRMLAASEGQNGAALAAAFEAGIGRWPRNADLRFAAGNHARLRNDAKTASRQYLAALELEPLHAGALNNYADLLLAESCYASAFTQIIAARRAAPPGSPLYTTVQATAQEITATARETRLQDSGELCMALTTGLDEHIAP